MQIEEFFTTKSDGNIAYHVTNETQSVDTNRKALKHSYALNVDNMHYMEQTHGCNIHIVTQDSPQLIKDCDALITQEKQTPLMVMVADCIPILLKDENKGVIAVIHAGRNSTFQEITPKTVQVMIEKFKCNPKDIQATLGPSIQQCCYEVDETLANIVKNSFGKAFEKGRHINLQGINQKLLQAQGVENIVTSRVCTKCSNENYFSYRLDKSCGRFAGISVIKS